MIPRHNSPYCSQDRLYISLLNSITICRQNTGYTDQPGQDVQTTSITCTSQLTGQTRLPVSPLETDDLGLLLSATINLEDWDISAKLIVIKIVYSEMSTPAQL